jgi:hypothetical protein
MFFDVIHDNENVLLKQNKKKKLYIYIIHHIYLYMIHKVKQCLTCIQRRLS